MSYSIFSLMNKVFIIFLRWFKSKKGKRQFSNCSCVNINSIYVFCNFADNFIYLIINTMRIIKLTILVTFLLSFWTFNSCVFTYQVDLPRSTKNIQSPWTIYDGNEDFYNKIWKTITTYIWFFTWVVAFVVVLTAGYHLFSSKGNPENLKKANKMLIWWLVWIFVSLLSYVFVRVLITLF